MSSILVQKKIPYVTSVERKSFGEGKVEGSSSIFMLLLEKRFSKIPPNILSQMEQANAAQIEAWSLQLLDVRTLDEIFKN